MRTLAKQTTNPLVSSGYLSRKHDVIHKNIATAPQSKPVTDSMINSKK